MKYLRYAALLSIAMLLLCTASGAGVERQVFTAAIDADGVQRVEMLGTSYYFTPNYIILKINVPVEIKIRKEGLTPHDFVLQAPEAGMDVKVDLGKEPILIKFTPTKAGTYPFLCDKKVIFMQSHREKGMEGIIEVRE